MSRSERKVEMEEADEAGKQDSAAILRKDLVGIPATSESQAVGGEGTAV